jgi:hypothetical protein
MTSDFSIGMACTSLAQTKWMGSQWSLSVPSFPATLSCTTSTYPIKLVRCYGHCILLGVLISQTGTFWYHSHLRSQYCDGLRGPFVIYDPNDPHADLYDIDDGLLISLLTGVI